MEEDTALILEINETVFKKYLNCDDAMANKIWEILKANGYIGKSGFLLKDRVAQTSNDEWKSIGIGPGFVKALQQMSGAPPTQQGIYFYCSSFLFPTAPTPKAPIRKKKT
jgi:hypothetical protein